jgi:hypothetical protein
VVGSFLFNRRFFIKIDPILQGHRKSKSPVPAKAANGTKGAGVLCALDMLPRYRTAFLPPKP